MNKDNAVLEKNNLLEDELHDSFDFEALQNELEDQLADELADLSRLQEEKDKIGNLDNLSEVIMDSVWEQFLNQIAVTAGEDFIKENHGMRLDLRNDAHIQTAENFAKGKLAKHNYKSKEQLEYNYNRFKNTSHKEFRNQHVNKGMDKTLKRAGQLHAEGTNKVKDIYTGRDISTKTKLDNGKNNPQAAQREHVKSSSELYKNAALQMGNSDQEFADVINHPENLQGYTTAERNNRKSDKSTHEMDQKDKTKHHEKADERAEKYVKSEEKKSEERLKKEGRQTQKEEAFRITGKALRSAVMALLADLAKEVFRKLIKWLKSGKKKLSTFIDSIKEAFTSFFTNLKSHFVSAGKNIVTTILSAIWGPIVGLIRKVWNMLKQGWQSLKEAFNYLKNPENQQQPLSIRILEVGKIITAGVSATGALALGEVIEKALLTIPILAVEIPLLGSLANIIGLFSGGLFAGIFGAIAISLIDRLIANKMKSDNMNAQTEKRNEILNTQQQVILVNEVQLESAKSSAGLKIHERHQKAASVMHSSVEEITNNLKDTQDLSDSFSEIDDLFNELEEI